VSTSTSLPQPYRFKSSPFALSIPSLPATYQFSNFFPKSSTRLSRFMANIRRDSEIYRFLASVFYRIRTWSRRTIWGDRLFLQFVGPTTILLQSRASRVRDVLSEREVDEIADAPPGKVAEAVESGLERQRVEFAEKEGGKGGESGKGEAVGPKTVVRKPPKLSIASVQRDGKVRIEEAEDFEQLKR
jgi:Mitochondrial biogenesis AIM24